MNRPTDNARGELCGRTGQLAGAHRIIPCSVRAYSAITTVLSYNANSCSDVPLSYSIAPTAVKHRSPMIWPTAGGSYNNIIISTNDGSYWAREDYRGCGGYSVRHDLLRRPSRRN